MLHVTILAVGGLKERYLTDACAEYQKRLAAFCKLQIVELPESRLPQEPAVAEIEKALAAECKCILAKLPQRAFLAALCIEGKDITSEQLAGQLETVAARTSQLVFIIGGSHGLSPEVKSRVDLRLSMSAMTFPHQLARVMLLEQLYRAFSISAGRKYHK